MTTTPLAAPAAVTPSGDARARKRRRPRIGMLRRWVSPLVILVVWQLLCMAGVIDERQMASPTQILARAVELVQDGTLGSAVLVSLKRVALGLGIGGVTGLVLALVAGLSKIGDNAIDPPMQMLRTLPFLGLIPLFIIWMGIGETPKIALIALGVTFPLYLNTLAGIRGIDRKTMEAARAMHLTWAQRIRHVVLPGAMPQMLTGVRQSLGIAWLALIVAETVSASSGLGYLINHARDFLQIDVIVVGLTVYALLGLVTDALVRYLESRALAWRA